MSFVSSGRGRRMKQGFPGRHCLLTNWANYFLIQCRPGIKVPSRKEEEIAMFQGTTIEDLINSVVRAEDHAREQEMVQAQAFERQQYQFRPFIVRQEMVEVA
jgi:hypothetical protein